MARDNSPVNNTCPAIDDAIGILEDLREANAALRAWGNEQYDRAEDFEEEMNEWHDKYDESLTRIAELEKEIDELTTLVIA